ncbi:MAG: type I-F CRISPR-associated endoribonuclease Cas6/Csy4 [Thermodesulfobacteriota bacterium]|nr:type I-F CRISPR-associated endoribonuclease Cas6/Csy4 [Thermodesulfobacteriota bacterium]
MDHYTDVTIMPDAEMRENVLLNKVYTKLHKALSSLGSTDIGVSFPDYNIKLGRVLRIHGTSSRLAELQAMNWLGGLVSYCDDLSITPIPTNGVSYRTVSRKQVNMTAAKLRRLIKRGSIPDAEVKIYKANMFKQGLNNPYLELQSASNGHKHRRYISFGELVEMATAGQFDQFGLSKDATVPWYR